MAELILKNISKRYHHTVALEEFSLDIREKEFLVLFGPAGAGKTTLLSIISGILACDEGDIFFDARLMNDVTPNKRNVAMVFENYALYPHFSVYDNIAFPLRSPAYKKSEAEIKTAVLEITRKMNISHLLERLPSQMSNGQRQRVALGRALVRKPHVFLMDEPLAHLDAKLKNFMRTELKAIQQQLDTTTIYVTHDYLEALSLGDRIAIIDKGSLVQVGTAEEIYYQPCNTFVAKLVGEPEINIHSYHVEISTLVSTESKEFRIPLDERAQKMLAKYQDKTILAGIRGVDIVCSFQRKKGWKEGRIEDFYSTGNRFIANISCEGLNIYILLSSNPMPQIGKKVFFHIDPSTLLFFNRRDARAIRMKD